MDFLKICESARNVIAEWRAGSRHGGDITTRYGALSSMLLSFKWLVHRNAGQQFFLGILRSFSMTPAERRAIEAGARYFGVRTKKFTLPPDNWEPARAQHFDKLNELYGVACRIIERGDACKSDQFCTARCFRLVNTGDFPLATMQSVQAVVDTAARILDEMGFGHLCYGDVYVTKTVMRSSKILAFYMLADDRMYVRANLKGVEGAALHTVLHEIGHRLENLFSGSATNGQIGTLYRTYLREHEKHGGVIGGTPPQLGDTFVYRKETFRVTSIIRGRVVLRAVDPALKSVGITMPVVQWLVLNGGKPSTVPFPTQYSMRNPQEFFAEMFALEMVGKLDARASDDISKILEVLAENKTPVRVTRQDPL